MSVSLCLQCEGHAVCRQAVLFGVLICAFLFAMNEDLSSLSSVCSCSEMRSSVSPPTVSVVFGLRCYG